MELATNAAKDAREQDSEARRVDGDVENLDCVCLMYLVRSESKDERLDGQQSRNRGVLLQEESEGRASTAALDVTVEPHMSVCCVAAPVRPCLHIDRPLPPARPLAHCRTQRRTR